MDLALISLLPWWVGHRLRSSPRATKSRRRAKTPLADLPEGGWPAVLFSARDRLLSVRSSRRKQTASGLREVVSDVHDPGTPETEAAKAARQTPETYELRTPQHRSAEGPQRSSRQPHTDADDLHPIDYGTRQRRSHELDPAGATAALSEKEQKDRAATNVSTVRRLRCLVQIGPGRSPSCSSFPA